MNKVKVILADDHKLVLDGMKHILHSTDKYDVVFEAEHGQEVLDYLKKNSADIILLDLNMPVLNGIETTKRIKSMNAAQKIIILSMVSDIRLIKTYNF